MKVNKYLKVSNNIREVILKEIYSLMTFIRAYLDIIAENYRGNDLVEGDILEEVITITHRNFPYNGNYVK